MSAITIIFSHYGYSTYLEYTLSCAKKTNPNARFIFLGDQDNADVARRHGWEHYEFSAYRSTFHPRFEAVFRHVKGPHAVSVKNGRDWLRYVTERWLFLEAFANQFGIRRFWHFDSDTMILQDIGPHDEVLKDFDFSVQCNGTCLNGIVTLDVLNEFSAHICKKFSDEAYLRSQQEEFDTINPTYSLTEMRLFDLYKSATHRPWLHLLDYRKDLVFDDCICQDHGFQMMEMPAGHNPIKQLFHQQGRIFGSRRGELVEFVTLNLSWVSDSLFQWVLSIVDSANQAAPSIEARLAAAIQAHQAGRLEEAKADYQAILRDAPNQIECYNNLGLIALEQKSVTEAEANLSRAIELAPDNHEALNNLGNLYNTIGRRDDAIAAYRQALGIFPAFAAARVNLGTALQGTGDLPGAEREFRAAIEHDPTLAEAHSGLGHTLISLSQPREAAACFMRAVAVRPDWPAAWNNLGSVLRQLGLLEQSVRCLQRAVTLAENFADALLNLGNAMTGVGRIREATVYYERVLALHPDHLHAISNFLLALNYADHLDAATLARKHTELGARIEASVPRLSLPARTASGPIRLGYASPDMRTHAVAFFFEPLLRAHDRSRFEIFCYAELSAPDSTSHRLRSLADHWIPTLGMTDQALAERIAADRIDILVDLAGHSARNRLAVFARKPAPIQATWLGYPNTTGLSTIDYRLVDAVSDPAPEADGLASERLVRLEGGFHCYQAPADAPPASPPPFLAKGHITFGSFNNIAKLSDTTLTLWAALMRRVPDARLIVKSRFFGEETSRERFWQRLAAAGIAPARVELKEGIAEVADHLAAYGGVDISLDSFPYNGTTTLFESLWMGVPAVTLRGDRHMARVGASILSHVGLADLVADSAERYVEIAAGLAGNHARLADLRASLRRRMQESSFGDAEAFARKMEQAFDYMLATGNSA